MPEFTDEQLREHDESVQTAARAQVETEIINDTSWKSLGAMKDSAINADKRIGEETTKTKAEQTRAESLQVMLDDVKKNGATEDDAKAAADAAAAAAAAASATDEDHKKILQSMTDDEAKKLDAAVKANPALEATLKTGGEKAMAEALTSIRELDPPKDDKGKPKDGLFGNWKQTDKNERPLSIKEQLEASLNSRNKKNRAPISGDLGGLRTPIQSDDDGPAVRADGGLGVSRMADTD